MALSCKHISEHFCGSTIVEICIRIRAVNPIDHIAILKCFAGIGCKDDCRELASLIFVATCTVLNAVAVVAMVAAAGPLSNIIIAVFFGLFIRFWPLFGDQASCQSANDNDSGDFKTSSKGACSGARLGCRCAMERGAADPGQESLSPFATAQYRFEVVRSVDR